MWSVNGVVLYLMGATKCGVIIRWKLVEGGESIHLSLKKGFRSLLNTLQGRSGQDSKGEERLWNVWNLPTFGNCAWLKVAHLSVRPYWYFEVGHLMGLSVFSQGVTMFLSAFRHTPVCLKMVSASMFSN